MCDCTLFELPSLFPYVGRKSWHVLIEGAVGNVQVVSMDTVFSLSLSVAVVLIIYFS
jgi:hypothetical protein